MDFNKQEESGTHEPWTHDMQVKHENMLTNTDVSSAVYSQPYPVKEDHAGNIITTEEQLEDDQKNQGTDEQQCMEVGKQNSMWKTDDVSKNVTKTVSLQQYLDNIIDRIHPNVTEEKSKDISPETHSGGSTAGVDKSVEKDSGNSAGGVDNIKCCICEVHFSNMTDYTHHLNVHSRSPDQPTVEAPSQGSAQPNHNGGNGSDGNKNIAICTLCQKQFSSRSSLRNHIDLVHHKRKRFSCTICQKLFNSNKHLTRHLSSHSDEKPFSCTLCEKHFSRLDNVDRHVKRVHLKLTPFSCTICSRSFPNKYEMEAHTFKCYLNSKSQTAAQYEDNSQIKTGSSQHEGPGQIETKTPFLQGDIGDNQVQVSLQDDKEVKIERALSWHEDKCEIDVGTLSN